VPDRLEGLSADAKQALEQARARVAELTQAARERMAGTKPGGPGTPAA
jgi:F0F1-type ATP synthase membrane subunit b/b'